MSRPPAHGGDLAYAETRFGPPSAGWQDLSTGISPWSYAPRDLPEHIWRTLPGDDTHLVKAAADYYRTAPERVFPVPGSQYAIARLPTLVPQSTVAVPEPGYIAHERAWQRAGHRIVRYGDIEELHRLAERGQCHHAVVINPNNPTGEWLAPQRLLALAPALPGYLLVDEAFVDTRPEFSIAPSLMRAPRVLCLRSLGKFFGLAGLRLGFVLGRDGLVQALGRERGEWAISHPAQWLGERAQRDRLQSAEEDFVRVLRRQLDNRFALASGGLFVTVRAERGPLQCLYQLLARQGVFSRWCYELSAEHPQPWLRLGIPDDDGARVGAALQNQKGGGL